MYINIILIYQPEKKISITRITKCETGMRESRGAILRGLKRYGKDGKQTDKAQNEAKIGLNLQSST